MHIVLDEEVEEELPDRNCGFCAHYCFNYDRFRKMQNFVFYMVNDFIFEMFITFIIVLNVLSMAISYYGQPPEMDTALDNLNYVSLLSLLAKNCFSIKQLFNQNILIQMKTLAESVKSSIVGFEILVKMFVENAN